MPTKKLVIELPEELELDQGLLRNVLAEALYKKGRLAKKDVGKITGQSQHEFEEYIEDSNLVVTEKKVPDEKISVSENQLNPQSKVKGENKWARHFREMSEENFLSGVGEEVLKMDREFKENTVFKNTLDSPWSKMLDG